MTGAARVLSRLGGLLLCRSGCTLLILQAGDGAADQPVVAATIGRPVTVVEPLVGLLRLPSWLGALLCLALAASEDRLRGRA